MSSGRKFSFKGPLLAGLALTPLLASPAWASAGGATSPWPDLIIRAIVFAIFMALLIYALRKPVSNFFRERRENIASTLDYLETQEANLREQIEIVGKKMDELAVEREDIIAKFEEDGRQERDKLIAEARAAAERIRQQAEAALAQEIAQAREALKVEVAGAAAKLAEELLKKSLTPEDQQRLTKDFMAQVANLGAEADRGRLN